MDATSAEGQARLCDELFHMTISDRTHEPKGIAEIEEVFFSEWVTGMKLRPYFKHEKGPKYSIRLPKVESSNSNK